MNNGLCGKIALSSENAQKHGMNSVHLNIFTLTGVSQRTGFQ